MSRKRLKKIVPEAFQLYETAVQEGWRPSYEESDSDDLVPLSKDVYATIQRLSNLTLEPTSRGDRTKNRKFHAVLDDELFTVFANAIWNEWRVAMGNDEFPSKLWASHLELRHAFRNPNTPSEQREAVNKLHAIRDRWITSLEETPKIKLQLKDQSVTRRIRQKPETRTLTETEYSIVKLVYERPPVDTPTIAKLCGTTWVHRHISTINTKLKPLKIKLKGRYNVGYTLIEA